MVSEENHSSVVAKCTVELPARHQVIIPMRRKDKSCKCGLLEPTKTPGGVIVEENSSVREKRWMFLGQSCKKKQRMGVIFLIEDMSEPFHF